MSFDDVQAIWDSQQPAGDRLDRDALTQCIKADSRSLMRIVGATEMVMTLTLLFMAAMFMRDPLLQGHDRVLLVAAFACLAAAAYVWTGRVARKKREVRYDASLLGMVERSIAAIDYQIARMRGFLWCFGAPTSLGLLIGLLIVDDSKRYLFYWVFIPAYCLCMGLTWLQIGREIRTKTQPERRRLAQLRDQLIEG
ncbi:hypothetical protein Pla123a_04360 [Posidoniimonas polymericola]|uniref:Uncharacterized protein n=1 Tax=Posidoniimonas polymericola TaxID=2528002 RepID=A0A5C5ZDY0_9BACT|nr:hypothetical protein [Posidoniimonas polymericola]TWT85629.1 hypothetical protein Pla123a_04360 [Posidoniimonas polymericola]